MNPRKNKKAGLPVLIASIALLASAQGASARWVSECKFRGAGGTCEKWGYTYVDDLADWRARDAASGLARANGTTQRAPLGGGRKSGPKPQHPQNPNPSSKPPTSSVCRPGTTSPSVNDELQQGILDLLANEGGISVANVSADGTSAEVDISPEAAGRAKNMAVIRKLIKTPLLRPQAVEPIVVAGGAKAGSGPVSMLVSLTSLIIGQTTSGQQLVARSYRLAMQGYEASVAALNAAQRTDLINRLSQTASRYGKDAVRVGNSILRYTGQISSNPAYYRNLIDGARSIQTDLILKQAEILQFIERIKSTPSSPVSQNTTADGMPNDQEQLAQMDKIDAPSCSEASSAQTSGSSSGQTLTGDDIQTLDPAAPLRVKITGPKNSGFIQQMQSMKRTASCPNLQKTTVPGETLVVNLKELCPDLRQRGGRVRLLSKREVAQLPNTKKVFAFRPLNGSGAESLSPLALSQLFIGNSIPEDAAMKPSSYGEVNLTNNSLSYTTAKEVSGVHDPIVFGVTDPSTDKETFALVDLSVPSAPTCDLSSVPEFNREKSTLQYLRATQMEIDLENICSDDQADGLNIQVVPKNTPSQILNSGTSLKRWWSDDTVGRVGTFILQATDNGGLKSEPIEFSIDLQDVKPSCQFITTSYVRYTSNQAAKTLQPRCELPNGLRPLAPLQYRFTPQQGAIFTAGTQPTFAPSNTFIGGFISTTYTATNNGVQSDPAGVSISVSGAPATSSSKPGSPPPTGGPVQKPGASLNPRANRF